MSYYCFIVIIMIAIITHLHLYQLQVDPKSLLEKTAGITVKLY